MKMFISTAAAAVLALTATASAETVTIDFEGLDAGTFVTDQFAGVTVSATEFGALVFDTDNFTGGDDDLAAPFTDAMMNVLNPGNILIVSEDGDGTDPDDNGAGGSLFFDFAEAVTFDAFNVFDIDAAEGFTATFRGEDGIVLSTITNMLPIGDNGFASFTDLGIMGVLQAEFAFTSSGAVDDLTFDTAEVPVPAAGLLFLTGAAGFAAARKRKAA